MISSISIRILHATDLCAISAGTVDRANEHFVGMHRPTPFMLLLLLLLNLFHIFYFTVVRGIPFTEK